MLGQTSYADAASKYVAGILSSLSTDSMAGNGELVTPTSYPAVPNFLTSCMSSGTGTTPTLTPTSLHNLEQTFIELQSVSAEGSGANGGCEPHTQSGFVPPVVEPASREQSQDSFESSDPEWEPAFKMGRGSNGMLLMAGDAGQSSGPQRKYTRRRVNEKQNLTPEEEQRRHVRRERNKLAAAKCRQRRVDHTNTLVEETEKLEEERSTLESEIQTLQQEKDQLEFLLQAHVPICKVDRHSAAAFQIKSEPQDLGRAVTPCTPTPHLAYSSTPTSTTLASSCSSRPSSLSLPPQQQQRGREMGMGVPLTTPSSCLSLTTPSSGLYSFAGLEGLVEGSTGLTPLTAGPPPGVSCASQVHKNEGESESAISPTLVSL